MNGESRENAVKRGYLKGDFEFFHLKDRKNTQFEYHYHDFNKIIVFISGSVIYHVEGRAYRLEPWDILFINEGGVHLPEISQGSDYERIVLWMNQGFLDKHNSPDCNLSSCFSQAALDGKNLMRLNPEFLGHVRHLLSQLEDACKTPGFGSKILKNAIFLQLIVQLNRLYLNPSAYSENVEALYDERISEVLKYINERLDEDLSIEILSARFFLNKYYLMHRFKQQTGYTLHNYIMNKRIIKASALLKKGEQASEICSSCGFGDYSSFVRAFKKVLGLSPREYQKRYIELERNYGTGHSVNRGDWTD